MIVKVLHVEALEQFQRVVTLEAARGSEERKTPLRAKDAAQVVWRFKALQNIVILCPFCKVVRQLCTRCANWPL